MSRAVRYAAPMTALAAPTAPRAKRAVSAAPRRWTYEEYHALDDDQRYEVLDGELTPMAPAPDYFHQDWLANLNELVRSHARKHRLGKVAFAPLDVVLDPHNTVQPDLIFVAKANEGIIQRRGIFGVPDLLVEVVSPSSQRRDRYQKKQLYARFGVKETRNAARGRT